jgi:hypothetical protein
MLNVLRVSPSGPYWVATVRAVLPLSSRLLMETCGPVGSGYIHYRLCCVAAAIVDEDPSG